ncbi:MAG TPA: nitrate reductase cytochrome c-type subunit [Candidatus Acidoferrales bacterium]
MNKSTVILLATLALAVWQPASAQQAAPKGQTLRGANTDDADKAPEDKPYVGKLPGSQKPIARTFSGQPPLIPHTVENLDAITLEGNPCLACHGPANYKYVNAPKVGDSHFKDRDGKRLTEVSPARHNCTACHVPQADATPLVQNTFKGVVEAKKK